MLPSDKEWEIHTYCYYLIHRSIMPATKIPPSLTIKLYSAHFSTCYVIITRQPDRGAHWCEYDNPMSVTSHSSHHIHLAPISHFNVYTGMHAGFVTSASLASMLCLIHQPHFYHSPVLTAGVQYKKRCIKKWFLTLTALCGRCMKWSLLFFLISILVVKKEKITGFLEITTANFEKNAVKYWFCCY